MAGQIRQAAWYHLEGDGAHKGLGGVFTHGIAILIVLNAVAVVLESMAWARDYAAWFWAFEVLSVSVFSVELVLRFWVNGEGESFGKRLVSRWRYLLRPLTIIDILAIAPFFLMTSEHFDGRALRLFRLLRLLRLLKLGRYYRAFDLLGVVLRQKKAELVVVLAHLMVATVMGATLMYYVEGRAQPEVFSSIPASMWWTIVTFTTVGYGDVYPVTTGGRMLAGFLALVAVGFFALPSGILASGLTEELHRRREKARLRRCPHCGKELEEDEFE